MESTEADDLSFVILGHGSMSHEFESHQASMPSSCQRSLTTSDSMLPQKLDQLIQENSELRETLNKTNLTMKTQFENLTKWQQEVHHAHQTHKEKFFETRDLVLQLRAENNTLKQELTEQSFLVRELKVKIAELEICNTTIVAEKEALIKEKALLKNENVAQAQKIAELESLVCRSKEVDKIMSGDYKSLAYKVESTSRNFASSSGIDSTSDWSYLDIAPKSNVSSERSSLLFSTSFGENQEKGKQCKVPTNENDNSVELLKLRLHASQNEINELKIQLEDKDTLLKCAVEEADAAKREQTLGLSELRDKLGASCEEVNNLKKEIEKKSALLKSAMSELKQEREDAAVLKAQIEVYKSDYEDERSAREKLVGEKENLAEQLRALRDELSRLEPDRVQLHATPNENIIAVIPEEGAVASVTRPVDEATTTDENIFICPVCSSEFSNEDQCQRHVNFCLDNHISTS